MITFSYSIKDGYMGSVNVIIFIVWTMQRSKSIL